jgi:ubiquinone/menaquinone biosynthesis C-methylase UbiE
MKKYYKTGEFAKMANLTIRTIRYYDNIGLLKPSKMDDNGYRLYSDKDFLKLQKIITLKNLGFSLDDIFSMTINDSFISLQQSLSLQKKMIDQKIHTLKNMKESIIQAEEYISISKEVNWEELLKHINITNYENELVQQYKNSTNINIRIKLHEKYSINTVHWFEWLFQQYQLKNNDRILELGCGNGELWLKNIDKISNMNIILSDISNGMLEDAKNNLNVVNNIKYEIIDCHHIPYDDNSFDIIIANHLLFYLHDINKALSEIKRVLKPNGVFYCSTYGSLHMKEITDIIKEYNPKINLSNVALYKEFGLENGNNILLSYFNNIELRKYDDYLLVDNSDDLINYILSCHGNQSEYILKDYQSFKTFVSEKVKKNFKITKDAGVFICK